MNLTEKEAAVVQALAQAWNLFIELPCEHPDDTSEFRHGVHRLQEKVLARPGRRQINNRGAGL